MKLLIALMTVFSFSVFAFSLNDAQLAAQKYLQVDEVMLEAETVSSYFFITDLEYEANNIGEDYPCFRGVVVSKDSCQVVDPLLDQGIHFHYAYSDTYIDGLVVINCAD